MKKSIFIYVLSFLAIAVILSACDQCKECEVSVKTTSIIDGRPNGDSTKIIGEQEYCGDILRDIEANPIRTKEIEGGFVDTMQFSTRVDTMYDCQ